MTARAHRGGAVHTVCAVHRPSGVGTRGVWLAGAHRTGLVHSVGAMHGRAGVCTRAGRAAVP
jgi:hypothetical protein